VKKGARGIGSTTEDEGEKKKEAVVGNAKGPKERFNHGGEEEQI